MSTTGLACPICGRGMMPTPFNRYLISIGGTQHCLSAVYGPQSPQAILARAAAEDLLQLNYAANETVITLTDLIERLGEWAPMAMEGHQGAQRRWMAAQTVAAIHELELPPLETLAAIYQT